MRHFDKPFSRNLLLHKFSSRKNRGKDRGQFVLSRVALVLLQDIYVCICLKSGFHPLSILSTLLYSPCFSSLHYVCCIVGIMRMRVNYTYSANPKILGPILSVISMEYNNPSFIEDSIYCR